jgi:hypothetical protein
METQIDGIRAWIAMEKARARLFYHHRLSDMDTVLLYSIKLGYNTLSELAAFHGFKKDGRETYSRVSSRMSLLGKMGYIDRANRVKPIKGQSQCTYVLTKRAKDFFATAEDEFDAIFNETWKIDIDKHMTPPRQ